MAADACVGRVGTEFLPDGCVQFPRFAPSGGMATAVRHVVSFFFSAAPRTQPTLGRAGAKQNTTVGHRLPKRAVASIEKDGKRVTTRTPVSGRVFQAAGIADVAIYRCASRPR